MTLLEDNVEVPGTLGRLTAGTETEELIRQGPIQKANGIQNRNGETLDEAHKRILRDIPSTVDARSWLKDSAVRLPDAGLWRLIGDLGIVGRTIVRSGHRTPATTEQIAETYETIFREGLGVGLGPRIERAYTTQPFLDACRTMVGSRSAMQMARRTGIQIKRMQRILAGQYAPTGDEMAAIAETFGKQPWYFREVRSALVAAMVLAKMDDEPDMSARIVQAIAS